MNKKELNDLLDKREKRIKGRKEIKKKMDSIIGLSYHDEEKKVMSLSATISAVADNTARLIDEGYCDNGFILARGALEKYLNGQNEHVTGYEYQDGAWKRTDVLNLDDKFVGSVNLGHQDFATHPFILGEFTKADLKLEDIGDGRKALNVGVRLDEDSMYVKELKRQPYDIGVSAEFWYHVDRDATALLEESYGLWLPVIDEIFIFAYALVGDCGNVNSSGLRLKGDTIMPKDINEITEPTELGAEQEVQIEPTDEETPIEGNADPAENDEPAEGAEDENGDEAIAEETDSEEPDGDEGDGDEAADLAAVLEVVRGLRDEVTSLKSTITELTETNASLKKTNRKLSGKLAKENEKKKEFLDGVKGLSVQLMPGEAETAQETAEAKKNTAADKAYYFGDGIGEI